MAPMPLTIPAHVSDKRGVNLISDVLAFGRLWNGDPNAISNPIDYAKFYSLHNL